MAEFKGKSSHDMKIRFMELQREKEIKERQDELNKLKQQASTGI